MQPAILEVVLLGEQVVTAGSCFSLMNQGGRRGPGSIEVKGLFETATKGLLFGPP
jgi:hypothetical protein